ncbi:MAG: 2-phospho-L-lactate guanylyltransferase [Actinobacteria bacterium]|nr:2-phospho-L-lactate guanylyltransferase [Actinomycetota bacterium]MDA8185836.1 2-phospho-L-lactate guanylyltransferase [Actinomycetota bacterium]
MSTVNRRLLPRLHGSAVLVPVKAFAHAKARLAPVLDPLSRARLAQSMAECVIRAASPLPVAVVCDDETVAKWAAVVGAHIVWTPGKGLNGAVAEGVARLYAAGASEIVVAHADLPLATSFVPLLGFAGVTLVPDRRADGTNVACVPGCSGFRFSYGPGSFERHCAEAQRCGLALRVLHHARLSWDVDIPDDLAGDLAANLAGDLAGNLAGGLADGTSVRAATNVSARANHVP